MAFCPYCGRALAEGEVCNCQGSQNAGNGASNGGASFNSQNGQKSAAQPDFNKIFQNVKNQFESVKNEAGGDESYGKGPEKTPGGAYERGAKIVDECIVPMDEEIPVRQYDMAVLRTILPYKRAEGRLQVTNKRIIFRATGKSSLGSTFFESEYMIENIAGIEISKGRRMNFWFLLLGLIIMSPFYLIGGAIGAALNDNAFAAVLGILALLGTAAVCAYFRKKTHWLKMGLFVLSACIMLPYGMREAGFFTFLGMLSLVFAIAYLVLFIIKDDLSIKIKVGGSADAIEIRRKGIREDYTGYSEVLPWKDTDIAVRELGALINDVKLYGNNGIEKWRQ